MEDTPFELGGLCVLEKSHALPGFARFRETYAAHDIQRSAVRGSTGSSGIFTDDPQEVLGYDAAAPFLTAEYRAGDVLLFNAMGTVHGPVKNHTP